ncbi:hypothetical protein HY642_06615 [Candidatus Woesearchaeota archaeon]|nr:hypothetical protein [Candidatus Woesearchaeota archaeon]
MGKEHHPDPCILLDAGLEAFKKQNIVNAVKAWLGAIKENILIVPRLVCVDDPLVYEHEELFDEEESWEYLNSRWSSRWQHEKEAWFALALLWHAVASHLQKGEPINEEPAQLATFIEDTLKSITPEGMAAKQALEIIYSHARFIRKMDMTGKSNVISRLPAKRKEQMIDYLLEAEDFVTRFANNDVYPPEAHAALKKLEGTLSAQQKFMSGLRMNAE